MLKFYWLRCILSTNNVSVFVIKLGMTPCRKYCKPCGHIKIKVAEFMVT